LRTSVSDGSPTDVRKAISSALSSSALSSVLGHNSSKWRQPGDGKTKRPKTLLAITVSLSQWQQTHLMITSLSMLNDEFDVVLIDDHSVSLNIPLLAESLGIQVLHHAGKKNNSQPSGVTFCWNVIWKVSQPYFACTFICHCRLTLQP
jgi:hypothetical protein